MIDIIWNEETRKLTDLKPLEKNPRRISKIEFDRLLDKIQRLGYSNRIKVNLDNTVVGGHQRLKCLKQLKWNEVKVLVPSRLLTEKEFRESVITDNLSAGEHDFDILSNEWDVPELVEFGMPPEWLVGEEVEEVEVEQCETEEPEDDIPPLPKIATTQVGDIWLLGRHRLICGDSFQIDIIDRLMKGALADMCFLDPPYGINIDVWDKPINIKTVVFMLEKLLKPTSFFAFTMQMPYLTDWLVSAKEAAFDFKDHISWVKRVAGAIFQDIMRSHETLMIYKKGDAKYNKTKGAYSDVKVPGILCDVTTLDSIKRHIDDLNLSIRRGERSVKNVSSPAHQVYQAMANNSSQRSPEEVNFTNVWSFLPQQCVNRNKDEDSNIDHPTVKPLALMNRIIELCSKENEIVLDLFLGSGSTLISAEKTNRICYGVELSPHYCDVIVARWEKLTGEKATLEAI